MCVLGIVYGNNRGSVRLVRNVIIKATVVLFCPDFRGIDFMSTHTLYEVNAIMIHQL